MRAGSALRLGAARGRRGDTIAWPLVPCRGCICVPLSSRPSRLRPRAPGAPDAERQRPRCGLPPGGRARLRRPRPSCRAPGSTRRPPPTSRAARRSRAHCGRRRARAGGPQARVPSPTCWAARSRAQNGAARRLERPRSASGRRAPAAVAPRARRCAFGAPRVACVGAARACARTSCEGARVRAQRMRPSARQ
jgi:hypothetical protein